MGGKTIRERLSEKEVLVGSFLVLPSPQLVEMLALSGFDLVLLDEEHGGFGRRDMEECLRAADYSGIASMIRAPQISLGAFQQYLDMGAGGIQAAMVHDADAARQASSYSHYPPLGSRGMSCNTRASAYSFYGIDQVKENAEKSTFLSLQIESAQGLGQVDRILEIPGVDMIFVGAADLSVSLGIDIGSDELWRTAEQLAGKLRAAGKAAGIYVWDLKRAQALAGMGYNLLTVTTMDGIRAGLMAQRDRLPSGRSR